MFNKKLLIYVDKKDLKPTGGASGYNFNLNNGLVMINASNYEYLELPENTRNRIKGMKKGKLKNFVFVFLRIGNYSRLLLKKSGYSRINLNDYEVVHFHNVKDMYEARTSLENYKGIVVITSHSPKPFSYEIYEDVISKLERILFGWMYRKLIRMEKYAFNRANYIIFPCADAEEPYYDKWPEYEKIHKENSGKYRYLLTGTCVAQVKIDRNTYRKKYNIPETAFVISYIGRHNETKGYDNLKKLGEKLIQSSDENYMIVGGDESPLKGLANQRWIEVGWTDDPYSLVNSSDLFVLPNKQTYFDLVMLEVLSLGKIVIASNTGGNKYFAKIDAPGVFLYNNLNEAEKMINDIKNMTKKEKEELERANLELFIRCFSNEVFAQSYVSIINSME